MRYRRKAETVGAEFRFLKAWCSEISPYTSMMAAKPGEKQTKEMQLYLKNGFSEAWGI